MRTHSGAEPLVGLEINLMLCVVQQDGAIPCEKNRKMTLSESGVTKHAFIQLDVEYHNPAFPSQALGNIWTFGRRQVSRVQLHYFSCKDNQGENFKRILLFG